MASRRDFFRSILKPTETVAQKAAAPIHIRPPYAVSESLFQSLCIECESKACASSCEEGIIVISADGIPILNLQKSGCTFCQECANVCESDVLSLELGKEIINAKFIIDPNSCMAHHNSICFSCKEPCIDDAILFNGMFNPVIDDSRCTACGFCMSRCPTNAITFKPTPIADSEV